MLVERGLDITLPNNLNISAQVSTVKIRTETVKPAPSSRRPDLANATGLFVVGIPVQATLHLTNDAPVTDITTTVSGWFGASTSS